MGLMSCTRCSCLDSKEEEEEEFAAAAAAAAAAGGGGCGGESKSWKQYSFTSQLSLRSLPSLGNSHHLQQQIQQQEQPTDHQNCVAILRGHSSYISALTTAQGTQHYYSLYSGSSDGEIRFWASLTNTNNNSSSFSSPSFSSHIVAIHRAAVKSLVIKDDKLFSAHQDHKICVWQINPPHDIKENHHHKLVAVLPTPRDRFSSLLLPRNYVQVRRHKKCTWVHHVDALSALAVSHDGCLLYSASWDRTIKAWRTSDYRCMESVADAHHDAINAVVVSKDGNVYTGSADRTIKVWKRLPGERRNSLAATLERHKAAVNALALSPDGLVLYSGGCDRTVVVWEGGGGTLAMAVTGGLKGHRKAILSLSTGGSGIVCSGSADKTVRVWRRRMSGGSGGGGDHGVSYSCLAVLEGHRGPVKCLALVANTSTSGNEESVCGSGDESNTSSGGTASHRIYTGSFDSEIRVWDVIA